MEETKIEIAQTQSSTQHQEHEHEHEQPVAIKREMRHANSTPQL